MAVLYPSCPSYERRLIYYLIVIQKLDPLELEAVKNTKNTLFVKHETAFVEKLLYDKKYHFEKNRLKVWYFYYVNASYIFK